MFFLFRLLLIFFLHLANGFIECSALAKLGIDCTPFGLSLTVKGRTEVRAITLPPNFAKPLVAVAQLTIPMKVFCNVLIFCFFWIPLCGLAAKGTSQ